MKVKNKNLRKTMNTGLVFIIIGAIGVLAGAIFIPWGFHILPKPTATLGEVDLANEALETSRQVLDFVTDRERNQPQIDFNNWDESTRNLLTYSAGTKNLYSTRYGAKVTFLRAELKTYGLSNESLDLLCHDATNLIVIREGAIALGSLALKLSSGSNE